MTVSATPADSNGTPKPAAALMKRLDRTPFCMCCGYNLTGLVSARCPECGWLVDWVAALFDPEQRRRGTPAFAMTGWWRVTALLATLLLMLLRPLQFARRLRADEPILPAIAIALVSCTLAALPSCIHDGISEDQVRWGSAYLAGIIVCILFQCLAFATLCRDPAGVLIWWNRFRLFLLVSLYSTCFVALWPAAGAPAFDGVNANFFPFPRETGLISTALGNWSYPVRAASFYWWAAIILCFIFIRTRQTFVKLLWFIIPWVVTCVAYWAGYGIFMLWRRPVW